MKVMKFARNEQVAGSIPIVGSNIFKAPRRRLTNTRAGSRQARLFGDHSRIVLLQAVTVIRHVSSARFNEP